MGSRFEAQVVEALCEELLAQRGLAEAALPLGLTERFRTAKKLSGNSLTPSKTL